MSTGIEWTDETWNPTTGCDRVSAGCNNCYALGMAKRLKAMGSTDYQTDGDPKTSGPGFGLAIHPHRLDQPLRWKKPRKVFVNSMSDLFHQDVPDDFIAQVWTVMAATPQHTYQILTKRHARMRSLVRRVGWRSPTTEERDRRVRGSQAYVQADEKLNDHLGAPRVLPNVWLGVSVENQQWADIRIPALLDTPAAVRFLSCEPLLGPVVLKGASVGFGIDWVIVGGESGHGARPMHPDWARSLRDQCEAAKVPYLFKQWGAWQDGSADRRTQRGVDHIVHRNGEHALAREYATSEIVTGPAERRMGATFMSRVGKKSAGRELDGRTHDGYPAERVST